MSPKFSLFCSQADAAQAMWKQAAYMCALQIHLKPDLEGIYLWVDTQAKLPTSSVQKLRLLTKSIMNPDDGDDIFVGCRRAQCGDMTVKKHLCYLFRARFMLEVISYLVPFFICWKIFFQPVFLSVIQHASCFFMLQYKSMASWLRAVTLRKVGFCSLLPDLGLFLRHLCPVFFFYSLRNDQLLFIGCVGSYGLKAMGKTEISLTELVYLIKICFK